MEIKGIVTTTVLILALITISTTTAAAISCDCGDICVNTTGWWNDGGAFNASTTPIQAAVDAAGSGDVICVAAGSYTENVDIATSHLTLEGEGADVVTVTAANSGDHVFYVTADYVNISGFTATGAKIYPYAGIYLDGADHCNISDNTASNSDHGIYLVSSSNNTLTSNTANSNDYIGIYLSSSSNNTLESNTANLNDDYGIYLISSSNNTLESNTANLNDDYGIYLVSSSNNTLTSNTANSNDYIGISLEYSSNNTLTSNTANSNSDEGILLYSSSNITLTSNNASSNYENGIHLRYSSDNTLESNTASYNGYNGVVLCESSNNTLVGNTANSNNYRGIQLHGSNDNTLDSNTADSNIQHGILLKESSNNNTLVSNTANSNNDDGIRLCESSNNTLAKNTASSNNGIGIYLKKSSSNNNLIYNNYFNNTANARDEGTNQWNITKTAGTNIVGGPFLGGNYWSDYAGNDTDWDGLGDTMLPYNSSGNIQNGGDYHPLVTYTPPTPPDPVNLANTTVGGYPDYWVNYTWSAGTGNVTDSYNVSLNGAWTNGTEATFMNVSVNPCEWANITVLAYNASGAGTLSEGSVSDEVQAPCDTTPPVITITTPEPYELYTVGMTLNFSATDSESGVDTITGNLTNTSDVSQTVDSGFAPAVGVYTLVVTATDNAGNTNVSDPVFFVVYDPDGGHATGGGWFYPDGDSTLPDGKANFGFTARYKNDVSTGKLNFQYSDAGIHLKSTSIDWLTISAVSAQFQGTGTINGTGLYTFRVKAKDNGDPGVDVDHFDIKIWNGTDTEADPYHKAKNTISGGNIQVHTN